jgi:hypothetical protein
MPFPLKLSGQEGAGARSTSTEIPPVNVSALLPACHDILIMQSNGHRTQVLKRFYNVTEGTCSNLFRLPPVLNRCTFSN